MAGARIVAVLLCLGGKGSKHPDVSNFGMPRFLLTWAEGLRIPWRCWQSVGRCRASCRGQDGLDVCSEKPGSGTGPASQSILWWARLRRRVVGAGAPLMRPWPAGVLPKDRWRLELHEDRVAELTEVSRSHGPFRPQIAHQMGLGEAPCPPDST